MEQNIQAISDTALRIEWPYTVSLQLNRAIAGFCSQMHDRPIRGVVEWVPAFKTVTIYYQPHVITFPELMQEVRGLLKDGAETAEYPENRRTLSVPVWYGEEAGPDLKKVAHVHQLSMDEVIDRHQNPVYFVHMLGFLPGFPYLGGLDKELATPRLSQARREVPKGSVGIAHYQTGIYPNVSPGGWNIIGRTPLALMDVSKQAPFLFQPGDYVTFYRISSAEYKKIEQAISEGTYDMETHLLAADDENA